MEEYFNPPFEMGVILIKQKSRKVYCIFLDFCYTVAKALGGGDEKMVEPSKRDWKLYREKIGEWQERYMERLVKEAVSLILRR